MPPIRAMATMVSTVGDAEYARWVASTILLSTEKLTMTFASSSTPTRIMRYAAAVTMPGRRPSWGCRTL